MNPTPTLMARGWATPAREPRSSACTPRASVTSRSRRAWASCSKTLGGPRGAVPRPASVQGYQGLEDRYWSIRLDVRISMRWSRASADPWLTVSARRSTRRLAVCGLSLGPRRISRLNRTDVVYPVVDAPAAGGLTVLDRSVTALADSPRCMAEMICTGVVAAIGEICALDTCSHGRCRVWFQWVRHRFPHSHDLCRALSMTPSPPRA